MLSFLHMKKLALIFALALSACSHSSDRVVSEQEEKSEQDATQECLKHPEQAKSWGDCNVKKTIFDRLPKIRRCYEKTFKEDYNYDGNIVLKILLQTNGKVKNVTVDEGSLRNKMLSGCLVKEIGKLKFAKPPGGITPVIYYPFSLHLVKPSEKDDGDDEEE